MINGVIFKLKPLEDKNHKIWLLGVDLGGKIEENAIPMSDDGDRYKDLGYCQIQFVNYQVNTVYGEGGCSFNIKDILRISVAKETGDTPVYVAMKEKAIVPLIRAALKKIREGTIND